MPDIKGAKSLQGNNQPQHLGDLHMNTAANAVATDETVVANVTKRSPGRPKDPNGKFAQSRELVTRLRSEGKTRKFIIAELVGTLNLKEGSATVYYHNICKSIADATVASATVTQAAAEPLSTSDLPELPIAPPTNEGGDSSGVEVSASADATEVETTEA
jgi:hypothetical protein